MCVCDNGFRMDDTSSFSLDFESYENCSDIKEEPEDYVDNVHVKVRNLFLWCAV